MQNTVKTIVIPDDYQHATQHIAPLHQNPNFKVIAVGDVARDPKADDILKGADGLILIRERTVIDKAFIQKIPRVKIISQTGKVARNIDMDLCRRHNIDVVEGVGSPIAPAELTWLLMHNAQRQFVGAVNGMGAGHWQVNMGDTMTGKTLGIVGYGKIGKRVIQYAQAFDMNIQVWGSQRGREQAQKDGFNVPQTREDFFAICDIVSIQEALHISSCFISGTRCE